MGDLGGRAILDDDVGAALRGGIEGGDGRGDEERDAVVFARDGEVVGADLVGGVAVVRHAVRTDDDGVHLALGHEAGGGGVADERAGHLLEGNLVRGEARALVVGAGLVTVDVLEAAGLAEGADDAEGGAVARGGERAGVAVGEDADGGAGGLAHRGAEGVGAESTDGAVGGDVRGEHALALGDDLLRGGVAGAVRDAVRQRLEALDRLAEVHRGRAAGAQVVHLLRHERGDVRGRGQGRLGADELHRERQRGGDGDGGRAAHVHVLDRGPASGAIRYLHEHGRPGQLELVEELERSAGVANRL